MAGLKLWLLGEALGESVVLQTPGGQWGVIDAYASNPDDIRTHPTVARLRDLQVPAQRPALLLTEPEHQFSIACLAPDADLVGDYLRRMAHAVIRGGDGGASGGHNLISSVLLIRYGPWEGILAGDAEQASWTSMTRYEDRDLLARVRFLKVAHHGSENGHPTPFWPREAKGPPLHIALTCYRARGLPTAAGLQAYAHASVKRHATHCRHALSSSSPVPLALAGLAEGGSPGRALGEVHLSVSPRGCTTVRHRGAAGLLEDPALMAT